MLEKLQLPDTFCNFFCRSIIRYIADFHIDSYHLQHYELVYFDEFEYIINKFMFIILKMGRKLTAATCLLIEYYEYIK